MTGETPRVAESISPAVRERADLTANDIEVIRERHFGWEKASPKQLAAIFGVSHQRITAILNTPPASFKPDHGGGFEAQAAPSVNAGPVRGKHIEPAKPENAVTHFGSADNSPAHTQPGEGGDALPHFCPTLTIDTESDPGSWAQHLTDTASMRGAL